MNTSATGGPLLPDASPAPLEGQALLVFLQGWLVGLCGLPGDMVRPCWQDEAPVIPNAGDAWMAFRITDRPSDTFPYIGHDPTGDGSDHLQRQERLEVLCSFYDAGSTGLADQYAALLRDGAIIPQNLELLTDNNFGLIATGSEIAVPSLLKERWLYRVDLPITLSRQIDRTYQVLNLASADGVLHTDVGIDDDIVVDAPSP